MAFDMLRRPGTNCNRHEILAALDTGAPREDDSPVMLLFRKWVDIYNRLNDADSTIRNSEVPALAGRQLLIREAMILLPSQDARDHLAKIIASTTFGDTDMGDDGGDEFWLRAGQIMAAA